MVPHFKCGDHEESNNNRPISLLPLLSKVTERIALGQFNNYLTQKNRLTCHRSGKREHHSTETLSLLVGDHIFSAMDKKQITAMVLFVNYKIWVPPTKLFFGSKVILQTDDGPRVHGSVT